MANCATGIFDYGNIAALTLSPNPMPASGGQFEIDLVNESVVTLQLFNLLGTSVRTLIDHQKLSGTNTISFNGCNDGGRKLPGGCYFYSLESGDKKLTSGRLIILN